ncbi:MAG TPA: gluconokinase [Trueperaceae bacterium]
MAVTSRDGGVLALVVMGVSGSGKTTVGRRIAEVLGWEFLDADAFHSQANVAKMAAGEPLTEEDRGPWLAAMRDALSLRIAGGTGVVLACSALRRSYRDVLRGAGEGVAFLYLRCDEALARSRVAARGGHFFPAELVDSQFVSLEEPDPAVEVDVVVADASEPLAGLTKQHVRTLLSSLRHPDG